MNEIKWTPEFIAAELVRAEKAALPWSACSCGICFQVSTADHLVAIIEHGDWGDDYPALRPVGGTGHIEQQWEAYMDQITYGNISDELARDEQDYMVASANNYPAALAEIERLKTINRAMKEQLDIATDLGQARFEELETLRDVIRFIAENAAHKSADWCRCRAVEALPVK